MRWDASRSARTRAILLDMRATVFWLGITTLAAACAANDDDSGASEEPAQMSDDTASPSDSPSTPAVACGAEPTRDGEATYYDFADGSGACGFPATPSDLMVGAMNAPDYGNSAPCGACAHVIGPEGEVTVRVVDLCPECPEGHIDLSPEAFERIAPIEHGRVPIRWQYVPCDVSGSVVYHFKDGSNEWWTALQLRNIRHAVATLEYERDGEFVPVTRLDYNYFVEDSGMGPGPLTLRITDVYGSELVDRDIAPGDDVDRRGAAQFPSCE